MTRAGPRFVWYAHRLRKLAHVPATIAERIIALASQNRPRVLTYAEIAREVKDTETRAGRDATYLDPAVVPLVIRRDRPQLIEERRYAREALRPKPLRFDGRASRDDDVDRRGLYPYERARIIARARVFVEDADGRSVPAYTLADLGTRFGPGGRVLHRLAVRRVILAAPGGRELLAERLRARRAAASPAKTVLPDPARDHRNARRRELRRERAKPPRPRSRIKPESAARQMRRVVAREAYRLREVAEP